MLRVVRRRVCRKVDTTKPSLVKMYLQWNLVNSKSSRDYWFYFELSVDSSLNYRKIEVRVYFNCQK